MKYKSNAGSKHVTSIEYSRVGTPMLGKPIVLIIASLRNSTNLRLKVVIKKAANDYHRNEKQKLSKKMRATISVQVNLLVILNENLHS